MTAATVDRVVVSASGPVTSRACYALGDGRHVWVERPAQDGPYGRRASFATDVAAASEALRHRAPGWVAPVVAYDGVALVHAPVPPSALAVSLLGGGDAAAFATVGRMLAEWHALDVPAPETSVMHADLAVAARGTAWLPPGSPVARAAGAALAAGGRVACHGRWSVGSLLVAGGGVVAVLAGADVWRGPREHDLGYLLGELVEHAAVGGASRWSVGARALLAAYAVPVDPDLLVAHTALRLVDHLLRLSWRDESAAASHASLLLAGAAPLLDELHAIGSAP
ncbi:MAG TPA: hypothetical protein VGX28_13525 [Frankiaceae bacterium]|jgi:hypothetical protein|nr:hypothetical protein [Frankiaceae bacterium]